MPELHHDIVPAHLAVQAMRDNGYKNAAYALAELIDNAVQAGATLVELLCAEQEMLVDQRKRTRICKIAVLDNGEGMDSSTLRIAMQFGNGTHLSAGQTGIGRFGMGLPASSISQCTRVDVWSWQDGVESAIHTYLDIEEIRDKRLREVPEPKKKNIPKPWKTVSKNFGKSGTLVVWSNLDRVMWKTASAVFDNSEFLVGRMYRKFLNGDKVKIRMVAFDDERPATHSQVRDVRPNDPLYLMADTSTPAPFDTTPMFKPLDGGEPVVTLKIRFRGKDYPVKITFSYAKEEARSGNNPGSLPHGKHAARNVGVSVVRAGRELELDESWTIRYDPVERWWGVEVEFPPALDDLFGVTNNKQSARNFAELAQLNIEEMLRGGKTITQLRQELADENDPREPLIELAHRIQSQLSFLRRLLGTQTRGIRAGQKRHDEAEKRATEATRERQQEGHHGTSDREEDKPATERQNQIQQVLVDAGLTETTAQELAAKTVSEGLKYTFAEADIESSAFFSVKPRGGAIIITLNTNHPAYSNLVAVLEKQTETNDIVVCRESLKNTLEGLKLLLMAWARYEDEQPDGPRRSRVQEARTDWGIIARRFLERDE